MRVSLHPTLSDRVFVSVSAVKLASFAYAKPVPYEGALEDDAFVEDLLTFLSGAVDTIPNTPRVHM